MARKHKHLDKSTTKLGKEFDILETDAKDAPVKDIHWKGQEIGAESETKLQDDKGSGKAVIVRRFTFGANPEAFKQQIPTKQELFNSHLKGIEIMLWRDGLKLMTDVPPQIVISKDKKTYQIFVGAEAAKGQMFSYKDTPQTLSQVTNGNTTSRYTK